MVQHVMAHIIDMSKSFEQRLTVAEVILEQSHETVKDLSKGWQALRENFIEMQATMERLSHVQKNITVSIQQYSDLMEKQIEGVKQKIENVSQQNELELKQLSKEIQMIENRINHLDTSKKTKKDAFEGIRLWLIMIAAFGGFVLGLVDLKKTVTDEHKLQAIADVGHPAHA